LRHDEVFDENLEGDDCGDDRKKEQSHTKAAEDERKEMFPWVSQPTKDSGQHYWDADEDQHREAGAQREQDLKDEIAKCLGSALPPVLSDAAFLLQHTIEKDKAHSAADVEEQEHHGESEDYQQPDADGKEQASSGYDVESDFLKLLLSGRSTPASSTAWNVAATQPHFSGKQSYDRQADPLPEPHWAEQLFLHVLESGTDHIDGGKSHSILLSRHGPEQTTAAGL
jgi:hypothetical protein